MHPWGTVRQSRERERGFTYLSVMFIVAVLGLTAAMASSVWSTLAQRANERELVFVGQQFQSAIERYRQQKPGLEARYPQRLEDLLRDARSLQVARHLRRVYIDPMTGRPEWGLVRGADGGIVGVHSLSERKPMAGTLLAANFEGDGAATTAATYRDWRFIAPSAAVAGAAASAATAASAPGPR